MPDGVENAADGLGEEDQIGLGNGFGQRRAAVDGPAAMAPAMAGGELTPVIGPSNPAWRKARPKDEPIRPVPTMTTFFMREAPSESAENRAS